MHRSEASDSMWNRVGAPLAAKAVAAHPAGAEAIRETDTLEIQGTAGYTLRRTLAIWAAAAAPMAFLGWVVAPGLASASPTGRQAFTTRVMALTIGLMWQFVLAMIIVYREEGDLHWATIRRRLWLTTPKESQTGRPRGRLWLWLVPLLMLITVWELALHAPLDNLWIKVFPFFAEPPGFSGRELFESQAAQAQLVGAWDFLVLFAVNAVFNTVLGEEFLLRGVLLPKMKGVFGKWDWLANGVLFGVYHLHQPWALPGLIVSGTFLESYPARRFQSVWLSIIVHSAQSVFFLFVLVGVVLGLS